MQKGSILPVSEVLLKWIKANELHGNTCICHLSSSIKLCQRI